MKSTILILLFAFSFNSFAASGSSGSSSKSGSPLTKGSSAWIVIGGGTLTPGSPNNANLSYSNNAKVQGGGDVALIGPMFASFSIYTDNLTGNMHNYNYTAKDNSTYVAQEVGITQQTSGGELGLQIRLINATNLHLFAEGGAFAEFINLTYDFSAATYVSGNAIQEGSQNSIFASGTYLKAGVDLIFGNGYGVRLIARASKGTTASIDALGGQKMKYTTGEGLVGLVKQF
jgi:hypothetical protein